MKDYGLNYKEKIKSEKKYNIYEYLNVAKDITNLDILLEKWQKEYYIFRIFILFPK